MHSIKSKRVLIKGELIPVSIFIDKGKIIEKGTHSELIENETGTYSALARLQFEFNT